MMNRMLTTGSRKTSDAIDSDAYAPQRTAVVGGASTPGRTMSHSGYRARVDCRRTVSTENIDDVKCVLHKIDFRVLPQALTTRSISTQAPSGSATTPIVVRAGKG